jgi:hypothetical protein
MSQSMRSSSANSPVLLGHCSVGAGDRICSVGIMNELVPSTRTCAIEIGTGMSFNRVCSATVLIVSSS